MARTKAGNDRSFPLDDPVRITRHIETRCHARHRQQLTDLLKPAEMIGDLHCGDQDVAGGLSDTLSQMIGEIEVYMKKEESILFPAIGKGELHDIERLIDVMHADHVATGQDRSHLEQ